MHYMFQIFFHKKLHGSLSKKHVLEYQVFSTVCPFISRPITLYEHIPIDQARNVGHHVKFEIGRRL